MIALDPAKAPAGSRLMNVMRAMCPGLSPEEVAAHAAPCPDERHRAGARRLPGLVPILPDDPSKSDERRAWESLARFTKPFPTAFTDRDRVTAGWHERFQLDVPGAAGQPHATIRGAGPELAWRTHPSRVEGRERAGIA